MGGGLFLDCLFCLVEHKVGADIVGSIVRTPDL